MRFSHLLRDCGLPAWRTFCQRRLPVLCANRHRCVSTVSRLTSAFNTKPSRKIIPRFNETNKGLFGIPELVNTSGFKLLDKKVVQEINTLIDEICDPNRSRKMVTIFDDLSDCICRVADMADFVRVSHPDPLWRNAAENVCSSMGIIIEKLNTNTAIYKALSNVIQKGDIVQTTEIDKRVAELFLFDFEQSGIHLEESQRQQFVDINDLIMRISNKFMYNTQLSTPPDILDLEKEITDVFTNEGGRSLLKGLQSEHYFEMVREAAYKIFLFPNPEQSELLDNLLEGRRVLAHLVGFPSYAHRTLKGTLAESHENVMTFLWTVSDNIREGADKDYARMQSEKAEQKLADKDSVRHTEVMPWDPVFFTMQRKNKMYDAEKLVEYFSLGTCMDGLSNLFEQLFDITLETVKPSYGELWSYDVYKVAVVHKTEGVLGYIYCDFYEREGKPNQDCHFTIQGGRVTKSGDYQLPMVVLHLNLPFPSTFTPSLLSPSMMENLFHEFGHAMHSMLGRTQYQHVTGTRCPIDFAEVPSVLMEYFASDFRVLKTFAKHYKTGEPISDDLLNRFCWSKNVYVYSEMQLQVMYAILDQIYHGEKLPRPKNSFKELTTTEILEEVQNRHYGIPYIPKTAWQLRFGHLVGYGGKYYSYLMSRAIASKIWRDLFSHDPFNKENGDRYRRLLLAHGGEKHPKELIADLFGEEPTIQMMVESLTEDLRIRGNG